MSKNKQKGSAFEKQAADYLNRTLNTDTFHRLAIGGTKDEGDVYGLFAHSQRIVIECKNHRRLELSEWLAETEKERGNADALAGVCLVKRKGTGTKTFGKTYAVMTLDDLIAIITGVHPNNDTDS